MSRIPDDDIARLKLEVSLERLVTSSGVELHRQGKDLVGKCLFHDDDSPSLIVSPQKNLWHCLGKCQEGGTVIDWVMKTRKIAFREAVDWLRGDDIPTRRRSTQTTTEPPAPLVVDAQADELMNRAVAYYHARLKDDVEALAYLREVRGLQNAELIEHFQIGVVDRTLGNHLPPRQSPKGRLLRERLQRLGLMKESGHELFHGCIVFPVRDDDGRVVGMYGRRMHGAGAELVRHLYLPGPRRGVYNAAALVAGGCREVILCESVIDALTFWCAGYRNVTCSWGVGGFSEEHLAVLKRAGTERVLIAYDRDEAGDAGAAKVAEELMAAGFSCFRVQFPHGMDANEYALKVQPAEKSLGMVLRKAEWLGKGTPPAREEVVPSGTELTTPSVAADSPASTPSLPAFPTTSTTPVEPPTPRAPPPSPPLL